MECRALVVGAPGEQPERPALGLIRAAAGRPDPLDRSGDVIDAVGQLHPGPEVQLSYRVDDIAAAVERVRAAGGHADEPERRPFGLLAVCVDDQGATFHLWQPAD